MEKTLKIICAWCLIPMGEKPSYEDGISHGICQACLAKQLAELKQKQKKDKTNE